MSKIAVVLHTEKTKEGPGPGPRTPASPTMWGLKQWNHFVVFPQVCSVRNSPHLIFTEGPSAASENKSRCWVDSVISIIGMAPRLETLLELQIWV